MNFDIKNYNNIFTSYDKQFFYDKYLNEYTEYELSAGYLAGLIDGDGSICCSKS